MIGSARGVRRWRARGASSPAGRHGGGRPTGQRGAAGLLRSGGAVRRRAAPASCQRASSRKARGGLPPLEPPQRYASQRRGRLRVSAAPALPLPPGAPRRQGENPSPAWRGESVAAWRAPPVKAKPCGWRANPTRASLDSARPAAGEWPPPGRKRGWGTALAGVRGAPAGRGGTLCRAPGQAARRLRARPCAGGPGGWQRAPARVRRLLRAPRPRPKCQPGSRCYTPAPAPGAWPC